MPRVADPLKVLRRRRDQTLIKRDELTADLKRYERAIRELDGTTRTPRAQPEKPRRKNRRRSPTT